LLTIQWLEKAVSARLWVAEMVNKVPAMPMGNERKKAEQRSRHALWAGAIAMLLTLSTLLMPLDQFAFILQSRLANFQATGDTVFLSANEDISDPDFPGRRVQLAQTIDALRSLGVARVYVDVPFSTPSTPEADRQLNEALRGYGGQAFMVRHLWSGLGNKMAFDTVTPRVGQGIAEVGTIRWRNYFGHVWEMPNSVSDGQEDLTAFHLALARKDNLSDSTVINYGFALDSIPSLAIEDIAPATGPMGSRRTPYGPAGIDLAGKTVVIGTLSTANSYNIPGRTGVPGAILDIYAAETLDAGFTRIVTGWEVVLAAFLLLLAATRIMAAHMRKAAYAVVAAMLPCGILIAAWLPATVMFSGLVFLLLIYAGFRLRAKAKEAAQMVDPDTGLPTFAALEADRDVADTAPTIIVARIHRFEEVKRTLPRELHAEYMLRLIGRLKAAKHDATIYIGQGHLIAWTFPEKEPALIRDHLEGLRALFAAPLLVGDNQVDVRITFGVDITPSPNVTRRVAAAVEAAERTTETYEPVVIAETTSDEDLIWNISLQARIDAALANGEIFMIYQPKVEVQTGEIVGAEALVRWRDPVKGLIPPDHFIRQCETAGRMAHLTRHVLTQSCLAGVEFQRHGMTLPIAVNISATLVHEPQIVSMVSEVLQQTGYPASNLTLEITETYRISNFERAGEVLGDLRALGAKISMDDFGVGAASLEALQKLPFSEIKIDRIFIAAMKDETKAKAIVRSVLEMGRELGIVVVAEGVEDSHTLTILRDSGCRVAQGFGISRPISFEEILQFHRLPPSERLKMMV
jgi:EAL domain-containing protein (putative c-di-GMP-specific phosphodiesterase class I)